MKNTRKTPRIPAQPPIVYFGAIFIGVLLNHFYTVDAIPKGVRLFAGIPLTLLSICLSAFAFREFIRRGVSVDHKKSTKLLITTGPFRISRNPLYLSGIVLVFGVGVALDNLWIIGLLIPAILLVIYGTVLPEEKYLQGRFGELYLKYRSSVRRWI
jgi:protein-S-isoprenylcysteine O-methyltransferase Ste14